MRIFALFFFAIFLLPLDASASTPAPGAACDAGEADTNTPFGAITSMDYLRCVSSVWTIQPVQPGAATAACASGTAGQIQWTGAALQYCNGSSWTSIGSGGSTSLSGLTAATTTNAISNANFAQIWTWNTLSTQTALTLSTSSMTTGTLLSLTNTATGNNAGTVLSVNNAAAGAGYGVYSTMTAAGGTGYAGYFTNSGTGANYGVYGVTASTATNGTGVFGYASASSGAVYGVWGEVESTTNNAIGVFGYAHGTTGNTAGVWGKSLSTSSGYGVVGTITGANNTGYAGYFSNSATAANYGVYATTASTGAGYGIYGSISGASNTGYAAYLTNASASGWTLYAAGGAPSYFAGTVNVNSHGDDGVPLGVLSNAGGDSAIEIKRNTNSTDRATVSFLPAGAGNSSNVGWYLGMFANSNNFQLSTWDGTQNLYPIYVTNSGKVGIGTTSPSEALDVSGGHLLARGGSTPTVSACGTSPSASGTDNSFKLTMGTGTFTACTITFGTTWTTAPKSCVFSAGNNAASTTLGNGNLYISSITTTTISMTNQGNNISPGAIWWFQCM